MPFGASSGLGEIDSFLNEMNAANTIEALHAAIQKQLYQLGFEHFGYLLLRPAVKNKNHIYLTNKPVGWTLRYTEQRYISEDLVVRQSATSMLPFMWSEIAVAKSQSAQTTIFNEAGEFRLKSGGTIPIHGINATTALFSVASNIPEERFAQLFIAERHVLQIMATYLHEHIMRIGIHAGQKPSAHLSPREKEVLLWTARGKTAWEISEILTLDVDTVRDYIKDACKKFGTGSKTHAVALAVLHALIIP